ncbi:unnamed protein product [Clonostachys chloroleuca]|uniref:NAD-dependent epimerase/dehydratase domain-containing protein n=1 Tax=Clonostachys chloroleuca TaxID=1926264 RepID=A0AA35Q7K4_9HYPO|nr:unnamed protein product [Clonostachys chloroleuca]
MSDVKPQLLLFGATGYIAGVLLSRWHVVGFEKLSFKVTAAGRSKERLEQTARLLGISTLTLPFDNIAGLEEEVQKYDIVVQLADCDAFEATHAILRGMRARYESTSTPPLLYHASGAAFLDKYTGGRAGSDDEILSDLDAGLISQIPLSLPHRNVDDAIITADREGYLRSYIVVPFAVFGTARGIMHEAGIANPSSMPIPRLIDISMHQKSVPQLGEGRNQKSWVHVEDVASLFDMILLREPADHGPDGLFFCMNGEVEAGRITAALAEAFYTAGVFENTQAVPLPESDLKAGPVTPSEKGADISKNGIMILFN